MKKLLALLMALLTLTTTFACAEGFDSLTNGLPANEENPYSSELGDLFDAFDTENTAQLKAERQLPLLAAELNQMGTMRLYRENFSFRQGTYTVYLFSKVNTTTIEEMIARNCTERWYTEERFTENGVNYIMLTQYGDGLTAVISPEFSGYTMVMIERGLTGEGYYFPSICTTCKGNGDCGTCAGKGNCKTCNGKGKDDCYSCGYSGRCKYCEGSGIRWSKYSPGRSTDCWTCDGYGDCNACDGKGHSGKACFTCDGDGDCNGCNGSGNCSTCGGDGLK